MPIMDVIVWGETGDGKSTLINKLVGKEVAQVGKAPGGVTKQLTSYLANIFPHISVRLWDMPGAGDRDVPAYHVLEMLESTFSHSKMHGILLLSSRPDRMPLGAQLVAKLMDLCFANPDKWSSVALVGTKSDKYDHGDAENFSCAVLQEFNQTVQGRISKVTTVNYHNVQPVRDILAAFASQPGIGQCKKPQDEQVADVLRSLNGLEEEEVGKRKRMEEQVARKKRELEVMHQQQAAEREAERQRAAAREHAALLQRQEAERRQRKLQAQIERERQAQRAREEQIRHEIHMAHRRKRNGCVVS